MTSVRAANANGSPEITPSANDNETPETPEVLLGELELPPDKPMACFRLELFAPSFENQDRKTSWNTLYSTQRRLSQAAQLAVRNVLMHIGDLRAAGKHRYMTPAERANAELGIPAPAECYESEDIKKIAGIVSDALKTSATTEYLYGSVAQRITQSEFAGDKLKGLLRGDTVFPALANVGIMVRARDWTIELRPTDRHGKFYLDVVITTSAWWKGGGPVTLHCRSLHGRTLDRARTLLTELASAPGRTLVSTNGWKKGALTVRAVHRPGQAVKWEILLPYQSNRIDSTGEASMVVHRSVCNMLSCCVHDGDRVKVHHYPGLAVVALKSQMHARRRAIARDIQARLHPMRQGRRRHYKALHRLADAEARATQTELWRAARWCQTIAEKSGAKVVYLDDFRSFNPDQPGPPWEPYVRTFPWSDLLMKCEDALKRRGGFAIREYSAKYVSQRCPECGFTDRNNIARTPVVRGSYVEAGLFRCAECGYKADVDAVAVRNGLSFCEAEAAEGK